MHLKSGWTTRAAVAIIATLVPLIASAQWPATFQAPATGPRSIATDASGNVYVCGYGNLSDNFLVSYTPAGAVRWTKSYSSIDGLTRYTNVAVDAGGFIYVAGHIGGNSYGVADLSKFDQAGHRLWHKQYNGLNCFSTSLRIDPSGNPVVVGRFQDGAGTIRAAIFKYNPAGLRLWFQTFRGRSGSAYVEPAGLAIDPAGSIYLACATYSSTNVASYVTVKYDSAGTKLWSQFLSGPGANYDSPTGVAVDSSGNCVVTGHAQSGSIRHILTVRYDTLGTKLWTKLFVSGTEDTAVGVRIDPTDGSICIGGTRFGSPNALQAIKYSSSGVQEWSQTYATGSFMQAVATEMDAAGNLLVMGFNNGGFGTVRFSPGGVALQFFTYAGSASDYPQALAVDTGGNVFVTGFHWLNANDTVITTMRH